MANKHKAQETPTRKNPYAGEIIIPLNKGSLRCGKKTNVMYGDYLRLVDYEGNEIIYWDSNEWEENPELIGVIFKMADDFSALGLERLLKKIGKTDVEDRCWV
jgi:hypothetical protein